MIRTIRALSARINTPRGVPRGHDRSVVAETSATIATAESSNGPARWREFVAALRTASTYWPTSMVAGADDSWIDSPFRTKGVLYLGTRTYFETQTSRGIEAVAEQLPPGRLQDFIRQQFLAGSQYEVMVVPALIEAEARAMGQPLERYLLHRTRWQADRDIHGVYKLMLKLASPEMVITRLPKVLTQMFNFGAPTVAITERKRAETTIAGIPAALVPWLEVGFRVYCETAVQLAGGRATHWIPIAPSVESPKDGFPMRTLRAAMTWV
jgi:hypothetical protein